MKYLFTYFKRIIILLLMYTFSRIYFYINNQPLDFNYFLEFLEGLRFDISALVYINIPLFVMLFLPTNLRAQKYYHKLINWLFYLVNIPFLLINNIDIEYFKFTQKRSTLDLLQLITLSSDAKNIIPQYLKEYWPITLFSFAQVYLILHITKIPFQKFEIKLTAIFKQILILTLACITAVILARGGLQLKPIKPINAGELCGSQNTQLILNTPFCIIHSISDKTLKRHNYFKKDDLIKIYTPIHHHKNKKIDKQNIVIIILESFSKEFVGYFSTNKSVTPFLDSLFQNGIAFNNAYANGLKSIEALPAITASIPALMNNPFITSSYAQNKIESLASILNKEGYSTSFFHGGLRGTMGFYSFSKKAGFDQYHGMEEYNNNSDFDGTWGIFDEPFMQYFSQRLNSETEPFFSTFFSLSSHPPYVLPKNYNHLHEEIGILETISYTDYALKNFFNKIKNEKWFQNTLFVITSDHTSGVKYDKKFRNKIGRYSIPLLLFKGDGSLKGINNTIVQQIDIMPTLLQKIGYNKPYLAFGKSILSKESWAISMLNNNYFLITDDSYIYNNLDNYNAFSNWELNKKTIIKSQEIKFLKAIKQQYNSRMNNNNLTYEN